MTLRFRGGARLQRGRGFGGILRVLKSVFSPIVRSIGKTAVKAAKSKTGKLIGNKIKEQAIDSALNLTSNALKGNDLESSLKTEVQSAKETAAKTLDQIRSNRKRKREFKGSGVGVLSKKVKFNTMKRKQKKTRRSKNLTRKKTDKKLKNHLSFKKKSRSKSKSKKRNIFNL